MKRFVEGVDRGQATLFPDRLDDWVGEDNAVRVVDVYVDGLDLGGLGFGGVVPLSTGRPAYHPSILLKLYIYGYLNRVQSSRRLEREAERNVEVMWLCGRLVVRRCAKFVLSLWPCAASSICWPMRAWRLMVVSSRR
jgi:transposase